MTTRNHKTRALIVVTALSLAFTALAGRLFQLHVLRHSELSAEAAANRELVVQHQGRRGEIRDCTGNLLANSQSVRIVCADPSLTASNAATIAARLAPLLKMDRGALQAKLTGEGRYIRLKAKVDEETAQQIRALKCKGLIFEDQYLRTYPQGSLASHVIGFVDADHKGVQGIEASMDKYLEGVEGYQVIERNRKGVEIRALRAEGIEPRDGFHVVLTIDQVIQHIAETELEKAMTEFHPQAGVIIVSRPKTGEILAMSCRPTFDLNRIREDYARYLKNPRKPMTNRCLAEHYPPGSSIKPIILLAGLEEHKITATEVISCPAQAAENGWPNCLLFRQYHSCHDWKWPNFARNAIRGSCNVYFSRLASRLEVPAMQRWLWEFGFGRRILPGPELEPYLRQQIEGPDRFFPESPGIISLEPVYDRSATVQDIPTMPATEKRWFGIGQGNLRVTVLQVANAFAVIARGGVFKNPRLFASDEAPTGDAERPLKIAASSLAVVLDGMHAVVYEEGGTANKVFAGSDFDKRSMTIYGKTGSTERPYHAWFACWATDPSGRAVSVAILVEGGASGARDACPIGRRVLEVCNEFDYIGTPLR